MGDIKKLIEEGKTLLGIEFGSTRIKAVLTDYEYNPIASGSHAWENRLDNGMESFLFPSEHGEIRLQKRLPMNLLKFLDITFLRDGV